MIGRIKDGFPRWGMYALTLIYLEVIFQWMVFGQATWGMLYGSLFGIPVAVLCAIASGLGPRWLNKTIATVLLVFLEILFVAQRIYYDIFKTFLSFFSITNGTGNAVEFSEIILDSLGKIWWQILLLLLPLIPVSFYGHHLPPNIMSCSGNAHTAPFPLCIFQNLFQSPAANHPVHIH